MSSGHSTPSHFCLLFDCDGTLVDSEILLADVMGEIFPEFGLPFSAQQYMEEFRGVRFHTIVHTLEHRFHKRLPSLRQECGLVWKHACAPSWWPSQAYRMRSRS